LGLELDPQLQIRVAVRGSLGNQSIWQREQLPRTGRRNVRPHGREMRPVEQVRNSAREDHAESLGDPELFAQRQVVEIYALALEDVRPGVAKSAWFRDPEGGRIEGPVHRPLARFDIPSAIRSGSPPTVLVFDGSEPEKAGLK
jgi:hypothetical protein